MQHDAPTHGKYALRTGRVLDKPLPVLELSSMRALEAQGDHDEIDELEADDVLEDDPVAAVAAVRYPTPPLPTPAPPVIARLVRTTAHEPPDAASDTGATHAIDARACAIDGTDRAEATLSGRKRGRRLASMVGTVIVLAALGAVAGLGVRALAHPPAPGAAVAGVVGDVMVAPGDRAQKWAEGARTSMGAPPEPPELASPPRPETAAPASPAHVAARAPAPAHAALRAHAPAHAANAVHAANAAHAPKLAHAAARANAKTSAKVSASAKGAKSAKK